MESTSEFYPTPQSGNSPNNRIEKPEKIELTRPSFLKKILHQSPDFTKSPKSPQIPKSEYKTIEQQLPPQQKKSFEDFYQTADIHK